MKSNLFQLTYGVANLGLILYGLMAILTPGILLDPFSATVYRFPSDATEAVRYLAALFRLLGYFNLLVGGVGLLLLLAWRRNHDEWILRVLIGLTMLAYLGPVIFDNTVGTIGFFEIIEHGLFAAVIVTGILSLADRNRAIPLEEK